MSSLILENQKLPSVDITDYLLENQPRYFQLNRLYDFVHQCNVDALKMLDPTLMLLEKFKIFSNECSKIMILNNMSRENLVILLKRFNHFKIESDQIKKLKSELLFRIWLKNSVRDLLFERYLPSRKLLESMEIQDYGFDKNKIQQRLLSENPDFKTLTDELKYFKSELHRLEDPQLVTIFKKFLKNYMRTLDRIHQMMNRRIKMAEVIQLRKEVEDNFVDCSGLAKKLKELSSVAMNQEKLEGVMERIEGLYRKHDSKREMLKLLRKGKCEPSVDSLEKMFDEIYKEGDQMPEYKGKSFLSSMKKAYETYLNLRKKEKDLSDLKDLLNEETELIGKRAGMEPVGEEAKTGEATEEVVEQNGEANENENENEEGVKMEIERQTEDAVLKEEQNEEIQPAQKDKLDLGLKRVKVDEQIEKINGIQEIPMQANGLNGEHKTSKPEISSEIKICEEPPIQKVEVDIKSTEIKNGTTPAIKNETPNHNNIPSDQKIIKHHVIKENPGLQIADENFVSKIKEEIKNEFKQLEKKEEPKPTEHSLEVLEEQTTSQRIEEETHKIGEEQQKQTEEEGKKEDPEIKEDESPQSIEEESEDDSLRSVFESMISSCESVESNEFILKQKKKIRKLKNLVICKREEQNHLVNEAEEQTSAFLYKKFSLVLLYYKLRVLGLDPETAAKTETYLKTVRDTDLIMKETALAKVTISELKQLVLKCENMKYFSQGYQKFKRLSVLFISFEDAVQSIQEDFRGDMRISFELRNNFQRTADLKGYTIKLISSKQKIILSRKALPLLGEDSKQKWVKLSNKRKTKLRQNFGAVESNPRNTKKKPKSKILNAMYILNNEVLYCLCQEKYELTSMLQFSECEEWFHKECIKIPKYQMRKTKEKFCPACFFLHPKESEKFKHFLERKRPFAHFLNLYRTAKVLGKFILDSSIDEIFYIHQKLNQLHERINCLLRRLEIRRSQGQALSPCWKDLHTVTLMYLYVPVQIESVEKALKNISLLMINQSKRIVPNFPPHTQEESKPANYFLESEINPDPKPSSPAIPAQSPNPFLRSTAPVLNPLIHMPPPVESDFKNVTPKSPHVQLVMKGVEVVQVPSQNLLIAQTAEQNSLEEPTQPQSVTKPRGKAKSIYGSLFNSAYLEVKKEIMEQINGSQS